MKKYQPMGTRVLLQLIKAEETAIHIPDSARRPEVQKFRVMAVGPGVETEKFSVDKDDIVQLVNNPVTIAGVDQKQELLTVESFEISVIVTDHE
jgi:co-chaperonin GroES (HSP10)